MFTVDLWSDCPFAVGAERLASVAQIVSASLLQRTDVSGEFELVAPRDELWIPDALPRRVFSVTDPTGMVHDYRIRRILDGSGPGVQHATVTFLCQPMIFDLSRFLLRDVSEGSVTRYSIVTLDATALEAIEGWIEPRLAEEGLGWIEIGSISPVDRMSIALERATALEFLAEMAGRTGSELWLERDAPNDRYLLNMGEQGPGGSPLRVSFGRGNLTSLRRTRDGTPLATVMVATGRVPDGDNEVSTISEAAWEVVGVSTDTLQLEDRDGGDGPIAFDGQLDGLYLMRPDGTLTEVLASRVTDQEVDVDDATGVTVGVDVMFVADDQGTYITELVDPLTSLSTDDGGYGRQVGTVTSEDMRGERNWAPDPFFGTWSSGLPVGWAATSTIRQVDTEESGLLATGASVGAQGSATINIDGLPVSTTFPAGRAYFAGSGGSWRIHLGFTTDGSGVGAMPLQGALQSTADNEVIEVHAFEWAGQIGPSATLITTAGTGGNSMTSPDVTVRYVPGRSTLWASVGYTMFPANPATATIADATRPRIRLRRASTDVNEVEVQRGDVDIMNGALRARWDMTATDTFRVEIEALTSSVAVAVNTFATGVRWWMLHLGSDSSPPPVWGSHATKLWQLGNRGLRSSSSPEATYELSMIDFRAAQALGWIAGEDDPILGGEVEVQDELLGTVRVRIVGMRRMHENPEGTTLELATIKPRLAKLTVKNRYAPPPKPDPTPPVVKPVEEIVVPQQATPVVGEGRVRIPITTLVPPYPGAPVGTWIPRIDWIYV